MMSTSKQFNELIKCKKFYCLLAPRLLFAGGVAASGVQGGGLLLGYLPGSPLCLLQAEDGSRRGWTSPSLRPSPMCCAGC